MQNNPWELKKKIHDFSNPGLRSLMHPNNLQSFVNTEWYMTQLKFWFSLSLASHGIFISDKIPGDTDDAGTLWEALV